MNISGGVLVALAGVIIGVWGKELVLAIFEKMFGKKNGNGNGSYTTTTSTLKTIVAEVIDQKMTPYQIQHIDTLRRIESGITELVTLARIDR